MATTTGLLLLLAGAAVALAGRPIQTTSVPLHNAAAPGQMMPSVGLGVGSYGSPDGTGGECWDDAIARKAVSEWLQLGGRRLDTSLAWYHDLKGVGEGMRDSGVPREEVFVLSKVDYPYTFNATLEHMEELLLTLNSSYVDLLLMHWPGAEQWNFTTGAVPTYSMLEPPPGQESCGVGAKCRQQAWLALEKLYKEGKAKAIGVANFEMHHLQDLLDLGSLVPAVNQIEFHPYWPQHDLVAQMERLKIQTCGYAPLGSPDFMSYHRDLWPTLVTEQPAVHEVAAKHNVSSAQALIRWSLQNGVVTNPRTMVPAHMQENLDVFHFELDAEDMAKIGGVPRPLRSKVCPDPRIVP